MHMACCLQLCLYLEWSFLDMLEDPIFWEALYDLEDINFSLLSENEQPLSCESGLPKTRLPRELDLNKALPVLLINLFHLY